MSIRVDRWDALRDLLIPLRTTVFIEEQQVPVDLEWDEEDAGARHFVAFDGQTPVGCARLLLSGQIGRMAVLAPHRGQGWGAALLAAAELEAMRSGLHEVFLHAQTHALPFYSRFGYQSVSPEFMDAGIPHRTMRKWLA